MLAIVKSVQHWRPYLLGRTFTVRTDQRSLKYLMTKQITTPAQAHWLPKLLGYDYKIEYKPGLANQAADSLSRKAELAFLSVSQPQAIGGPVYKENVLKILSMALSLLFHILFIGMASGFYMGRYTLILYLH